MPNKTLDIDADLKALARRAEKIRTAQRLRLGDLVLDTGAEKVFDADDLKDLLRWGMAQLEAGPQAKEAWRRVAEAGFPDRSGANGKPVRVPTLRARAGAPDLLSGAAAE